jgi:hypothetical protein
MGRKLTNRNLFFFNPSCFEICERRCWGTKQDAELLGAGLEQCCWGATASGIAGQDAVLASGEQEQQMPMTWWRACVR